MNRAEAMISKIEYWLGVCHGWYHSHVELELQVARRENHKKEKGLPIAGLEHSTLVWQWHYRNR